MVWGGCMSGEDGVGRVCEWRGWCGERVVWGRVSGEDGVGRECECEWRKWCGEGV